MSRTDEMFCYVDDDTLYFLNIVKSWASFITWTSNLSCLVSYHASPFIICIMQVPTCCKKLLSPSAKYNM